MPQLASSSSASSSVFARFKRTNTGGLGLEGRNNNNAAGKSRTDLREGDDGADEDGGGAVEWKGGKLVQHPNKQHFHSPSHRRESSIASLTTTVTDSAKEFGANVKRSVSLRSHRTHGSTSGSSFGNSTTNKPRSPGSANYLTRLDSASPVELSEEEEGRPILPNAPIPSPSIPSPSKPPSQQPLLKRKISLTAKGLTSKFKSTEALPSLNSPVYLQNIAATSPSAGDTMLVSSQPSHAPMGRKNSDQNRPGLQSQNSFGRDISGSSHGGSNGTAALQQVPSLPQGGPLNPATIYQSIQETSSKRIATIDYMRKLHEGDIFYFGTIHYSHSSLHSLPSMQAHKLGKRATNYFLLGYSLPFLVDLNSNTPLEYLKALSALLVEFETYQSLCGFDVSGNVVARTSRMGGMFNIKSARKGRRSSTAIAPSDLSLDARQAELLGLPARDYPGNPNSASDLSSAINPTGHEFQFLMTPHIPFEPDFSTTLGTLCDTLIDTYARLMELVSGPEQCSPQVGEAFSKADKAIRKILVANVVREFEETTRAGIKGEMAGLGKLTLGGLM